MIGATVRFEYLLRGRGGDWRTMGRLACSHPPVEVPKRGDGSFQGTKGGWVNHEQCSEVDGS